VKDSWPRLKNARAEEKPGDLPGEARNTIMHRIEASVVEQSREVRVVEQPHEARAGEES
jgi:hypothetical protein